jgi:choline dehydrogenase-like flavoprotein
MASFDYDVVIIGSGFGGSVAPLRAAEKGHRVGVMESGRRWKDEDVPKTQWDLPHFLWAPAAELYGIQRIEPLDDVLILSGAGVGGGSHVYANTLYIPPKQFFNAPEGAGITDWADELAPCIDQATRMLGRGPRGAIAWSQVRVARGLGFRGRPRAGARPVVLAGSRPICHRPASCCASIQRSASRRPSAISSSMNSRARNR